MDGLVLDSEPTYAYAWRQAAATFGAQLDEAFAHSLFGRQAEDVERALAERIGAAFDYDRFRAAAAVFWQAHVRTVGIAPLPGVAKLLDLLVQRRIPYALATNSEAPYAAQCLRSSGLAERFAERVTRDQVAAGKPAPDVFEEAARRLGVPASACLVLEDSATGLLAAQRAGATPVLVLARPAPAESAGLASAHFRSLLDVAAAIRRTD